MAESGQETSMPACGCVQCIQNWTTQSSALRENTVPTIQRSASYQMNTYTSSAVLTSAGSPNHLYNEYPSGSVQTQMSSYVLPSYETPIFRSTYGQMYNGTYSRPSPAIVPAEIRSYTPTSNTTWASQDTFEDLHSQTTPDTMALPDPNNWLYRINNFIPSETRTLTSAPQRIHSTMPLNDLPVIPQTLDVISSVSTFPTQPSSTPSSNNPPYLMSSTAPNTPQLSLSPNNPPSLMSSTAPSTPQLSLNIPSATVQESSIDSSDQYTLEFNNNANEPMASSMDYTEGNSESETEIDRNLPEEVSMPEEEIIDRPKQLCPHNDTDECDDDCPFLHGRLCHLCHTHRLNPFNPELHADACLKQHKKQSEKMECSICMEKVTELETLRHFGILENCNHCFCLRCLFEWRQNETMANHKACPVCRIHSSFAIGNKYWITCPLSKKKIMEWSKVDYAGM